MTNVAILGAGITGLSVAYALKNRGIPVTIFEKNEVPGGVIQSPREDGWLLEQGPNTMLVREQRIWDLLDDLRIMDRILTPRPEAKKRFIVRDGQPLPVPMTFTDFLTTDLLSARAKWRLLKEPFISAPEKNDDSIAHFIRRRFGTEPLDYLANPFVAGIYAGDPEQLSVKHTFNSLFEMEQQYGSVTRGFLKRKKNKSKTEKALISFDEGLHVLPRTMAETLGERVHFNTEVKQISPASSGWDIHFKKGGNITTQRHSAIVSTLPAYQLADILDDNASAARLQKLAEISYAPMSVLHLGFRHEDIAHPLDGFGMLIPEKEHFSLLGCLFCSSLFRGRAPKDHALLTCFIGGVPNPERAGQSTETLVDKILPQLGQLIGVKDQPVFQHHTFWSNAIPQYIVGYDKYLQAIQKIESAHSGLFLAGNYRGGVSVPDCILNGFETAENIERWLASD